MNPGRRDRLIQIQELTETRSASGGVIQTWANFCRLWANKSQGAGNEAVNADRRESENTVVWTTLFRSDVTTKMRIIDSNDSASAPTNVYNIVGISEVGRRHLMKITTTINK